MEIIDYASSGGKNLIMEYVDALPNIERAEILDIRAEIRKHGIEAFQKLNTRQLRKKLYEIKASQNRVMYIIVDSRNVVFLNICKKQKGKAEQHELDKAIRRAKAEGLW